MPTGTLVCHMQKCLGQPAVFRRETAETARITMFQLTLSIGATICKTRTNSQPVPPADQQGRPGSSCERKATLAIDNGSVNPGNRTTSSHFCCKSYRLRQLATRKVKVRKSLDGLSSFAVYTRLFTNQCRFAKLKKHQGTKLGFASNELGFVVALRRCRTIPCLSQTAISGSSRIWRSGGAKGLQATHCGSEGPCAWSAAWTVLAL